MVRRRLVVSGLVQGVWFRDSCRAEAQRLGLAGSAVNLSDGRVEVVVEGPADAVALLEAWCAEGPPLATVTGVEATEETPAGASGFSIG